MSYALAPSSPDFALARRLRRVLRVTERAWGLRLAPRLPRAATTRRPAGLPLVMAD